MQEAGGGFDWQHALAAVAGSIIGGIASFAAVIYRAGGKEPTIRADFQRYLNEAEHRVDDRIDAAEKRVEAKVEDMTGHFHEYFEGIRRQQDDMRLAVERDFVRKSDLKELREEMRGDLREFRDENRDDFTELKRNISKILGDKT